VALTDPEKNKLKKYGLSGLNKPKRTTGHPTKKGVVAIRDGSSVKIIRFGDQNMGHNYSPEARKSFKARHGKNIAKGKLVLLIGQISCSGLGLQVQRSLLLKVKSLFVV
jgi:hypothetical protein